MHIIFTDASVLYQEGKEAYAAAVVDGTVYTAYLGHMNTNNAEIEAIILALQCCEGTCVVVHTDNLAIVNAFTSGKHPRNNSRSYANLVTIAAKYQITWRWVKSGSEGNSKAHHACKEIARRWWRLLAA